MTIGELNDDFAAMRRRAENAEAQITKLQSYGATIVLECERLRAENKQLQADISVLRAEK